MTDLPLALHQVEEHARRVAARGREEVIVGPFAALFHPAPEPWLSMAVPIGPLGSAEELAEPIAALAAAFAARGRLLRVELCAGLWPTLPPALERAGLHSETEAPLLLGTPDGFRPRQRPDVQVRWVDSEAELPFLGSLMKRGFEAEGKIEPDEVAALAEAHAAGTRYAIAHLDALPSASGCSSPIGAVAELAALSTVPAQRGRGVGAALASFLAEQHFAAGGELVWISAGDDACYGLFSALGFIDAGLRRTFTAPEDPAARLG
jgi:GNAT superfamily N-acetyltransferase